ncbi:MAG TPA: DUF664 domain-containing protein [Amycolatopsis sp.]|jgi:uncharacterized damage-inducible protein DinB|nr:DUF664 domain-containing protein [Amycolatopsis sp.]
MTVADLLIDGFGRVRGSVHAAVRGLDADRLAERLAPEANSIAWLVWHLTRVQDDHFAELQGAEQVWTAQGWYDRFALPLDPADTGYGHSSDEVASVRVASAKLLTGYYDAVHDQTVAWLAGIKESQLDRIVDESWDPPVSLGVRLVSVLDDDLEHAGQAAFLHGILRHR